MNIYYFGNKDFEFDNQAIKVAEKFAPEFEDIKFICVDPNEDLPFYNNEKVIILDTVKGIEDITIIQGQDLDKIQLSPKVSVHDYDLSFQLKYLMKLNMINDVVIIGLPMGKDIDYLRLQSIFKKFVAQDIQGS